MDFLDKLKEKPKAKTKQKVKVAVPVKLSTTIIDKRSEEIDRRKILEHLKPRVRGKDEDVVQLTSQRPPSPPKESKKPRGKPRLKVKDPDEPPKEKVKRKLKITGITKGTITSTTDKPVRKTRRPKPGVLVEGRETELVLGDDIDVSRLPKKKDDVLIKASSYYMNNREVFINFINTLFQPYKQQLEKDEETISCDRDDSAEFSLLTHQKIVRDYLNLYTPYRGLLLYHGLGSGKTCSSIAIAEGMKSSKQVVIMTPASLRRNYIEELKNCGDTLYKKNQFWEYVNVRENKHMIEPLSKILGLSEEHIERNGGAWLVNIKKKANYESLSSGDRENLENQLNLMIKNKYQFINYNGLRSSHLETLTSSGTTNPFDNKVIVIDEAHNFISRIVNKLKRPESLSMRLYEYLMSAENCKIVLLTGTPIINYPNEIGILFNILRGYIKTWTIPLNIKTQSKVNLDTIKKMFDENLKSLVDFVEYRASSKTLVLTRNPFGFFGKLKGKRMKYEGVTLNERGNINDTQFMDFIIKKLGENKIEVLTEGVSVDRFKALPDTLEQFQTYFLEKDSDELKNSNLFKRRIIGLTSYFRSAQERLMPAYDTDKDFIVLKIPMSNYQFGIYESARVQERKLEKKKPKASQKENLYEDSVSTYRIFSRAFCNFVFPRPIARPMPRDGEDIETVLEKADEDTLDAAPLEERIENVDGRFTRDDEKLLERKDEETKDASYEQRINDALKALEEKASEYLSPDALETYSPKFLNVLDNVSDPEHSGLHLIYSQFRTLEGIGILKLILEANGFAQFKIAKNKTGLWELNMTEEELARPKFVLYTGTEESDEKEIVRNIFNSAWDVVPKNITEQLRQISPNNFMGEIIKVFMITASGAEGISLKNCRHVHLIEPYWHPVRLEQVIGRARRICSHQDLPEELRTVKVFLYLMTFTDEQMKSDASIELRLKDKSKVDKKTPLTSDETLNEISNLKADTNKKILKNVKEAAMDCAVHARADSKESLVCYSFGEPKETAFAFKPSISSEESDTVSQINKKKITWKAQEVTISGKKYALKKGTGEVYDLESYKYAIKNPGANPTQIGKLEKSEGKFKFIAL